ncbi:interferon gamma related [Salminus brasiliensis]|uniref:interferon gamma related n=1 Tax=Salminus brasiliensis TaxID=930266 RepID=UPI003B831DA5
MDTWFNLMLFCGLAVITLLKGTTGFSILEREHKDVVAVQTKYKLKTTRTAIFTQYLDKVETCTCEQLVFASMLNSYMDIFLDMLKNEPDDSLKRIKNLVNHLRANKYTKEQSVLKQLQEIRHLDVKNFTIQSGAMADFLSIYDIASKGLLTVPLPVNMSVKEKLKQRARKQKPGKQEGGRLKTNSSSGKRCRGKCRSGKHSWGSIS